MSLQIALTALALQQEGHPVVARLTELGHRLRIHRGDTAPEPDRLRELLDGAEGMIAGSERLDRDQLQAATRLRVIARHGVGYDAVDLAAATELGIVVTYVPDAMTDTVADLTMGMLLAAARRIPECDRMVKSGVWRRLDGWDLTGRTLGLVGTGRIGCAVARRATAFGMRVVGSDPSPSSQFEEAGGSYLPFEQVLSTADYLSLHAPGGPSTRGMIDARALAAMKPGSFLINCSRGSLVDEAALLEALEREHLAGAALDVLVDEPPSPGSPGERLTRHPRVVMTPHIGSNTPETMRRMGWSAMEGLLQALEGIRPEHLANPEAWDRRR